MGRKKNDNKNTVDAPIIDYTIQPVDKMCPTLYKATGNNEINLLDLSTIQLELERLLSSVLERLQCLHAEYKGKPIPPSILQTLRLRQTSIEQETQHHGLYGRPALVVKSNPEKPLTLIISQRERQIHQPPLPVPDHSTSRAKSFPNPIPVRRVSRSMDVNTEPCAVSSSDRNQPTAGYEIPNKFWELMEPYCAEITESNINYLEGLIRSYQDTESTYFQPPVLRSTDCIKIEEVESAASKRPRRDGVAVTAANQLGDNPISPFPPQSPSLIHHFASNSVDWATCVDSEMSKPLHDSSPPGKLSESLLQICFQDNILFTFTESLKHVADQSERATQDTAADSSVTTSTSKTLIEELSSSDNITSEGPFHIPKCLQFWVTEKASQPLKSLAKEFHVSTSYRLEKKISQAMNELGLIPLNVIHPTQSNDVKDIKSRPRTSNEVPAISSEANCGIGELHPSSMLVKISSTRELRSLTSPTTTAHNSIWLEEDDGKLGRHSLNRSRKSNTYSDPSSDQDKSCVSPLNRSKNGKRFGRRRRLSSYHSHSMHKNTLPYDREQNNSIHTPNGLTDQVECKPREASPSDSEFLPNGFLKHEELRLECEDQTEREYNSFSKYPIRKRTDDAQLASLNETITGKSKFGFKQTNSAQLKNGGLGLLNCNSVGALLEEGGVSSPSADDHLTVDPQMDGMVSPSAACGTNDWPTSQHDMEGLKRLPSCMDNQGDTRLDDCVDDIPVKSFKTDNCSIPPIAIDPENPQNHGITATDEVSLAILQRQRELRLVCSQNLSLLRKLVQAARRDMQRQEIQRRLAIADADVIEAYNKLESYRPQRKPPLKRDRDTAYKALKERRKVLSELEAFDAKPP